MATPRIFVSSTWYDLRYIRENLKYFIRTLGYEPVLSEEGAVFYDPRIHVQDACISEIPNCQLFILIIGGRYGSAFKNSEQSVANTEYIESIRLKIPVFALVEQAVFNDFHLFQARINNALVPFRDFSDIENYLRQQWAGMMFSFLLRQNEEARVTDMLSMLKTVGDRVEMLSRQILESVGTKSAKLTAAMYDKMLQYECVRDMAYMGGSPTPRTVLQSMSFQDCFERSGGKLNVHKDRDESAVGSHGYITLPRFEHDSEEYVELRSELVRLVETNGYSLKGYLDSM